MAGLTAAYILRKHCDVMLFEADPRLGGHAHTHDVVTSTGSTIAVDSGFIVHNRRTYPMLLRLFAELGVATRESEMSMSVHCDGCGLEYAGARGIGGMFAQPIRSLDPRHLATLAQVPIFHRRAKALLDAPESGDAEPTLGEFLARGRYTRHFIRHFLVPLVSAVWSCGPELVADYPARYLFTFLDNHGMLTVTGSPTWRTVVGGSRTYVERAAKELTAVHVATPVRVISRSEDGVEIVDEHGGRTRFDAAVVATHADQALGLLAEPTQAQRDVLGAFGYSRNETVLHTDDAVMPRTGRAQASWNYRLSACDPPAGAVRVTYDMNRLQGLVAPERYLVTLNESGQVRPDRVIARMSYRHPIYTPAAIAAQRRLPDLNDGVLAFAGAYHGWGFHEDGCRSGVLAAASLGVDWLDGSSG